MYFVAGCTLALLGWQGASRLRAGSLERLVFAGSPGPEAGRWTVALIFTPKECPSRMDLVERLNQLSNPRVVVRGIMLVDTRRFPGWKDAVVANRITFPVRAESPASAGVVLQAMGGLPTPVLAVYDPMRRLRLVTDLASGASLDGLLAEIASRTTDPVTSTESAR